MMAKFQLRRHHAEGCDSEACVARVLVAVSAVLTGLTLLVVLLDWILH